MMYKLSRRELLYGIIGMTIGVLIVGILVVIADTWSVANRVQEAQRVNTRLLKAFEDCTRPTGNCYRQNQRATASAIANINKVAIYASACAAKPHQGNIERVQICVLNRLQQDSNNEKPTQQKGTDNE